MKNTSWTDRAKVLTGGNNVDTTKKEDGLKDQL